MSDDTREGRTLPLRGFAALKLRDPEAHRAIAIKGGKAAHAAGTAHEFTREEAVEAGRKGGLASARRVVVVADDAGDAIVERGETLGNIPNTSRRA